ncbi:MAG: carbamoyltransferase HypF [bacterium]|nr:carbamoyltransferase HypF [bacterium]
MELIRKKGDCAKKTSKRTGQEIRVRGQVQGVGFRPNVWRLAKECELIGHVLNDGNGVLIKVWGEGQRINEFIKRLEHEAPMLARINHIESCEIIEPADCKKFHIRHSGQGENNTGIVPDAATCPDCLADIIDQQSRRYRYAFTNCTHCGPRLSIIHTIPYDRANTAMVSFPMCDECQSEYDNPADRRFHAQPNACPACGPKVWLEDSGGNAVDISADEDTIAAAARLICEGYIVAIKGIGGFHLACDATSENAVNELRRRKNRYHKPFALMARDLSIVSRYVKTSNEDCQLLEDRAAPIVLLERVKNSLLLASAIAPEQDSLGFMLPYTPLHHLLLQELDFPIVMTSGNISYEPQVIDNVDARQKLCAIADYLLFNDRDIVNRLDDSVVRMVASNQQTLRRARGYAPSAMLLPQGFKNAPAILSMGAQMKNTFCLLKDGSAILSQHMGDIADAATHRAYRESLTLYQRLFDFKPSLIAIDYHSGYHSSLWGMALAKSNNCSLEKIQHHHAHIAACMVEHGLPMDVAPVLGVVLDGLGLGERDEIWGGEFLLADYCSFERLGHFDPVPLPGGDMAIREPWRNAYAHLHTSIGWDEVCADYSQLEIVGLLQTKSLGNLKIMCERGLSSPPASSAGRLFDACAAMLDIHPDKISYEGQAAMELEALATGCFEHDAGCYQHSLKDEHPARINWRQMWRGVLDDLSSNMNKVLIARRFHNSVAAAIVQMVQYCAEREKFEQVFLSGGVFQNRLLLKSVSSDLENRGFNVLVPQKMPAGDGGISLGQAVITAARYQKEKT